MRSISPPTTSPPQTGSKRAPEDNMEEEQSPESLPNNPFNDAVPRERPSDYLRASCPLCFGGEFPQTKKRRNDPDAIVCIDACFTQKRNRQARDPPLKHPRSVFVPEKDVNAMEKYIESLRPSKTHARKKQNVTGEENEDFYEADGKLRVPKSVLDACESGFTAADDRREKASTQFFDDTALMALLCRHDIVLFIVNMSSAGEKQHYVITLVESLFQHLPLEFRIGLLYDIGCQAERSCVKWGFLDRYTDRILFGISVFHALWFE
ncbi:hypothetical protein H0H93_015406 [Arthromyces matolae]|nr:hypothetical protein H0H93_015406 [Arthromyces matolae]